MPPYCIAAGRSKREMWHGKLSPRVTPYSNGKVGIRTSSLRSRKVYDRSRVAGVAAGHALCHTAGATMRRQWYVRMGAAIAVSLSALSAAAQDAPAAPTATAAAPAQIDQSIVNLPTTLPLKRHGS